MINTKRQIQVLEFINDFIKENKISPTQQEIADEIGYINRQSASDIIDALCVKEYLAKTMVNKRNIAITQKGRAMLNKVKRKEVK